MRFLRSLPYEKGAPFAELFPSQSKDFASLATKLLLFDPTKRTSAAEALQHPYFSELRSAEAGQGARKKPPLAFEWDFDDFVPSQRALQHRVFAECAKLHPSILERHFEELCTRGFFADVSEKDWKAIRR